LAAGSDRTRSGSFSAPRLLSHGQGKDGNKGRKEKEEGKREGRDEREITEKGATHQ